MKSQPFLPPLIHLVKTLLPGRVKAVLVGFIMPRVDVNADSEDDLPLGRGEGLLKLQETQNRVILGIYRISIAGFAAFFLILLSLSLFIWSDPSTPSWLTAMLVITQGVLLLGFSRTIAEFHTYQRYYQEATTRLRELIRRQSIRSTKGEEHRLLAALKPKEYKGWDSKTCSNCERAIELSAQVCPHCGHDQDPVLAN
ncbi:MAG: zinc ribbon domain-containing protein [Deltaproteobacteria bacterium]|nr:zinc ribbon domain-containing protein [Deltaproteobacteria bacterium]